MGLLWHFRRSARVAFRDLLEGDQVLFEDDDDDGSTDGGGDSQGGDDDGGGDDESQADDDGAQGGDDEDSKAKTVEGAEYRKKLAENKNLRERAKKAEDELAKRRKADESDQERRDRELKEAQDKTSKLEAEARELRVQVLAPTVGILPEAAKSAYALVSWDDVDVDDEKAVTSALKALKQDHGYLFKSTEINAGARNRDKNKGALDDKASPQQRLSHAYAENAKE